MSSGSVELTTVDVSVRPMLCQLLVQSSCSRGFTVSLPDQNIRIDLQKIGGCLHAQRSSSCEQAPHGAEIILGAYFLAAQHVDDDWGNLEQSVFVSSQYGKCLTKNRQLILKCAMHFRYECKSNLGRTTV